MNTRSKRKCSFEDPFIREKCLKRNGHSTNTGHEHTEILSKSDFGQQLRSDCYDAHGMCKLSECDNLTAAAAIQVKGKNRSCTKRVSKYSSWPAYKFTCDHVSNISAQCQKLFYRLGVEETAERFQLEKRLYQNVYLYVICETGKDGSALQQTVEQQLENTSAYKEIGFVAREDSHTQWEKAYDPIIFVAEDGDRNVLLETNTLLKTAPSLKQRICVFFLQRNSKPHTRSKHWFNCSVVNTKPAELVDRIDDFLERYALETIARKAGTLVRVVDALKNSEEVENDIATPIISSRTDLNSAGLQQLKSLQQQTDNSSVNQTKAETIVTIEELLQRMIGMYKRSNTELPDSLKTIDMSGKIEDNSVTDALLKYENVIACGESNGTTHVLVDRDGRGLARDIQGIKHIIGTKQNAIYKISREIKRLAKIGSCVGESPRMGTLGCFATSRGSTFALISKHVADKYTESGTIKLGKSIVGQLQSNIELEKMPYRDIATAAIRPDDIDKCDPTFHDDEENAKECLLFDHNNDLESLTELVFFRGAATKLGKGIVVLKDIKGVDLESHMLIANRQDNADGNVSKFCQPGDSGSVVCTCDRNGKLYAIGMVVGEFMSGTEGCGKYLVLKLDVGLKALEEQHAVKNSEDKFKLCNKNGQK